jgi:hypothetical protein
MADQWFRKRRNRPSSAGMSTLHFQSDPRLQTQQILCIIGRRIHSYTSSPIRPAIQSDSSTYLKTEDSAGSRYAQSLCGRWFAVRLGDGSFKGI